MLHEFTHHLSAHIVCKVHLYLLFNRSNSRPSFFFHPQSVVFRLTASLRSILQGFSTTRNLLKLIIICSFDHCGFHETLQSYSVSFELKVQLPRFRMAFTFTLIISIYTQNLKKKQISKSYFAYYKKSKCILYFYSLNEKQSKHIHRIIVFSFLFCLLFWFP